MENKPMVSCLRAYDALYHPFPDPSHALSHQNDGNFPQQHHSSSIKHCSTMLRVSLVLDEEHRERLRKEATSLVRDISIFL